MVGFKNSIDSGEVAYCEYNVLTSCSFNILILTLLHSERFGRSECKRVNKANNNIYVCKIEKNVSSYMII